MSGSEIAQLRQQIAAGEESAQRALYGPASVASHEAIIARIEQGGSQLIQLFKEGREEEAYALWYRGILERGTP